MGTLSNDDFKYFDEKFSKIHSRISDIDNDISKIKIEAEARLTAIETQHKLNKENSNTKKKDWFSALSILGAYAMIVVMFLV